MSTLTGRGEDSRDAVPFGDTVTSEAALRTLLGRPSELALRKEISHLDAHCRAFIARSSFVLIATSGASGRGDVSPKGDPPGFVQVLDEHRLVIPDRPGNKRLDGMKNISRSTGPIAPAWRRRPRCWSTRPDPGT